MMEALDPESEHIREVYAHFGLASYRAQCVERALAILLATEFGPGIDKLASSQYDQLLESLFRETLGELVKRIRKVASFPGDLEKPLGVALQKRNWLAHRYFWERAGHLATREGRDFMMRELVESIEEFDALDQALVEISMAQASRIGMTSEILETERQVILKEALAEIRSSAMTV